MGLAFALLNGCMAAEPEVAVLSYEGVETRLLQDDLVQFNVTMRGVQSDDEVLRYAECAAGQYALIRGFGFARHLRSSVTADQGIWTGDAIYLISPTLPEGLRTIDAEVVVQACAEDGIPTV